MSVICACGHRGGHEGHTHEGGRSDEGAEGAEHRNYSEQCEILWRGSGVHGPDVSSWFKKEIRGTRTCLTHAPLPASGEKCKVTDLQGGGVGIYAVYKIIIIKVHSLRRACLQPAVCGIYINI